MTSLAGLVQISIFHDCEYLSLLVIVCFMLLFHKSIQAALKQG